MRGRIVKAQDLRPFVIEDSYWNPGYAPAKLAEDAPALVPREGFELMLDSAAISGDSAFIGVCFDLDWPHP